LKKLKSIWVILSIILIGIHLYFVPKQKFLGWSEVEQIEIKQRMDEYPHQYYRLANILENRARYFYRAEKIFFNFLDFNSVFYILTPIVVIGLFKLIDKKN